jgi:hypothetical protein
LTKLYSHPQHTLNNQRVAWPVYKFEEWGEDMWNKAFKVIFVSQSLSDHISISIGTSYDHIKDYAWHNNNGMGHSGEYQCSNIKSYTYLTKECKYAFFVK